MSTDNFPLVSLITPTYNRADSYLIETLESVLIQNYPNFEYIVLDDGSSDNTPQILEKYSDRIIWESHPNMGVIHTVNKGFRMAKGEFITVVNSDDPLLPDYIREAVSFMQAHSRVLAAYPDWIKIDSSSNVICNVQTYPFNYVEMISRYYCYPGPGTMLSRHALEVESGYDMRYPHTFDYEFYLRLGLHGELARIPKILATYREHSQTITSRGHEEIIKERFRMLNDFYNRPDLPTEVRRTKCRALSNANFVAGLKYLNSSKAKARIFFLRAILLCPFRITRNSYLVGKSWKIMFKTIFL